MFKTMVFFKKNCRMIIGRLNEQKKDRIIEPYVIMRLFFNHIVLKASVVFKM